jgi:hypothetical protein
MATFGRVGTEGGVPALLLPSCLGVSENTPSRQFVNSRTGAATSPIARPSLSKVEGRCDHAHVGSYFGDRRLRREG